MEPVVRSCAAGSTALRGLACAGSVTADGFAAEYWCADPATVILGCTASAAANFDPHATADDGSCVFPDTDIFGDGAALRAAFRAAAGGGWGGCFAAVGVSLGQRDALSFFVLFVLFCFVLYSVCVLFCFVYLILCCLLWLVVHVGRQDAFSVRSLVLSYCALMCLLDSCFV